MVLTIAPPNPVAVVQRDDIIASFTSPHGDSLTVWCVNFHDLSRCDT